MKLLGRIVAGLRRVEESLQRRAGALSGLVLLVLLLTGLDRLPFDSIVNKLITFTQGLTVSSGATSLRDLTVNGDAGVTGSVSIGGDLTATGFVRGGDAGFHNVVQSGDHFVSGYSGIQDAGANNVTASGVVSVASLEFLGGGTPGFERGGNTTVQTRTGDGFVALGASGIQSTLYVWDSVSNTSNGASCSSNTSAYCINDPQGFAWTNGSGTTVGVATAAGLISGDTGVSSGAWAVMWSGGAAVPEGSNGQGGYANTTNGRGSKFRQVTCSCRVAGSGGSDGITLSLMEDGLEVGAVEIVGGDTNACDDAAGTLLAADLNYSIVQEASYALQVKNTTDCAGNPTDCLCNIDVTR